MIQKLFTVYCLINRVNGKRYVGQTVDAIDGRWREHISAAKAHRGAPALSAAIRKYGVDAFDRETLASTYTQEKADSIESLWISRLNCRTPNGYNIAAGGKGPGYHHEDTKQRIGKASAERLANMSSEHLAAHLRNLQWTPERKELARAREIHQEERTKIATGQRNFWAKFTPEERSARVRHQISGMSAEQKSARVRKAWADMTPEARATRIQKAREGGVKAGPLRSKKMSEWQTARQKTLTSEQRRAVALKSWETRRRRAVESVAM